MQLANLLALVALCIVGTSALVDPLRNCRCSIVRWTRNGCTGEPEASSSFDANSDKCGAITWGDGDQAFYSIAKDTDDSCDEWRWWSRRGCAGDSWGMWKNGQCASPEKIKDLDDIIADAFRDIANSIEDTAKDVADDVKDVAEEAEEAVDTKVPKLRTLESRQISFAVCCGDMADSDQCGKVSGSVPGKCSGTIDDDGGCDDDDFPVWALVLIILMAVLCCCLCCCLLALCAWILKKKKAKKNRDVIVDDRRSSIDSYSDHHHGHPYKRKDSFSEEYYSDKGTHIIQPVAVPAGGGAVPPVPMVVAAPPPTPDQYTSVVPTTAPIAYPPSVSTVHVGPDVAAPMVPTAYSLAPTTTTISTSPGPSPLQMLAASTTFQHGQDVVAIVD